MEKLKATDAVVIGYMSGMTKKERLAKYWKDKDVDGDMSVNESIYNSKIANSKAKAKENEVKEMEKSEVD